MDDRPPLSSSLPPANEFRNLVCLNIVISHILLHHHHKSLHQINVYMIHNYTRIICLHNYSNVPVSLSIKIVVTLSYLIITFLCHAH